MSLNHNDKQDIKVVGIGGGHGLSRLLKGLKLYTDQITAIVTVADDGGGSGMLRRDCNMLPPGDIRNCMEALSNCEPVMHELIQYRFTEGTLAGQSFGNLFLAAMYGITNDYEIAVENMSKVLAMTGKVLPVTDCSVRLAADFENGTSVIGESKISEFKKQQHCRINSVHLIPEKPDALQSAVNAILEADLIVLGPGSLYTSIIPNLLVNGIVQAINMSDAVKIYACNVMTQEGETEGYTVSDHIRALFAHSNHDLFHYCLADESHIPASIAKRYAEENAAQILVDVPNCNSLGVEVFCSNVAMVENQQVKHNSGRLAQQLLNIYQMVK